MIRALLLLLLLTAADLFAYAQHPAEEMEIHERFYSNWMMPDAHDVSCCDKRDCHPAASRFVDGHWQARWKPEEDWHNIPPQKVEKDRESPDGRSHMCGRRWLGGFTVFCFVAGSGS